MERDSVRSSDLHSVGYDAVKEILEIKFKGSKIYQYYDVPKDEYDDLMSAESKGKYFHRNIKDTYEYKKM